MNTTASVRKKIVPNQRLREERERRNWTHKDVADRIELPDPHAVSRWERGLIFPSAHYRQALCRIFEKSPEELGLLKNAAHENSEARSIDLEEILYTLPTFFPPSVGRKQDIDGICGLLLRADVRLVTLLGTGGIGKTHLAMEAGGRVHEHFGSGICFTALDALRDSTLVLSTIVESLGIRVDAQSSLLLPLKMFLRKKHLLLLLDSFEYVVEAAPLIEELLQDCPNLKVLVTSRQRLNIRAEQPFGVQPLKLPNLSSLPEVEKLTDYSAIDLFVQRAQKALSSFKLTLANAQTIAELCVRLDGIPLAIELAAARINVLSPQALLARLIQGRQILKNNLRDIPDRQRTLNVTIDWSYGLLEEHEKWLFRHLSVFADGTTFETIEEFFQVNEQKPADLLETVDSLLAKCLLRNINEESEERPLGMFETIRTYGLSSLEDAGELAACQRVYALYYLKVVEQAEPYLKGSQQALWLGRLEREQKNLRTALGWLVEQKETWLALRFCEVFGKYCGLCGYWMEEKYWLDAVLSLPAEEPQDTAIRARVLRRAGHLAYRLRELVNARQLFAQSVMYARVVDDKSTLAGALSGLSWVVYRQKETMLADRLLQESLEIAQQGNDDWSLANILESRGRFLYNQGNNEEARTLLEQSVDIARKLSDKENLARILTTLVTLEIVQGNMEQARKIAQESYKLAISLKTRPLIALTLDTVGDVAIAEGAYAQAKQYIEERMARAKELGDTATIANRQLKLADIVLALGEVRAIKQALYAVEQSLALLREQEDIPSIIDALSMLADLYRAEGNLPQAQSLYLEALQLYGEFGEERKIGRCLLGLAQICLEQGKVERAAYLYGALEARQKAFTPMHPAQRAAYDQLASQIHAQLAEAEFDRALSKDSTVTLATLLTDEEN